MTETTEKKFDKYEKRGNQNWREMMSRDIRRFNAYQQARYVWILKGAGEVGGKKVLDLGSGGGSLTYLLAKRGAEVVGVENDIKGVEYAKGNLSTVRDVNLSYSFVNASAYGLPFTDESFDLVVSCDVIEHLENPEKMLAEARRVLRNGGKLVLTTPYRLTEIPQDPNHVHEYFPSELKELMEKYFSNVEVKLTHHMLWRSLYTYSVRSFGSRPLWKWLINAMTLWFGWNPLTAEYANPKKFDTFSSLCAWGIKK